jgi:hypothetical protein
METAAETGCSPIPPLQTNQEIKHKEYSVRNSNGTTCCALAN